MQTIFAVQIVLFAGMITLQVQAGITLTTLISFDQTNGSDPQAGLALGPDGNFYGTTTSGGANGLGTVFRITPTGAFTNLVSFANSNGASPRDGLLLGGNGKFYGTAYAGGANYSGILFQVDTNGALATVYTFSFAGGGFPVAGLIQDSAGSFYGATAIGGTNSGGTVFRLTADGMFRTLASFDLSGSGGNSPYGGLLLGSNGFIYGTTSQGGANGYGAVYEMDTNGALATVASFDNTNGANPYAGLTCGMGVNGDLFGTASAGGANGYGTIFKLGTNGLLTTMVPFGNTNGAAPKAVLTLGVDGDFYGTTSAGGDFNGQPAGHGTVFKFEANGELTTLFLFNGTNGDSPQGGLAQGASGDFFGTTANGGANGFGTVFRLSLAVTPPSFLSAVATGDRVTLTWSATPGKTYELLYKTNLDRGSWSNLSDGITATNAIMTTSDSMGADSRRFYQLLMLQ